jgi:site-specific recombinase, putative
MPEINREFVERIEIFKPEQMNGHGVQKMRIVWNCIGEFMPPQTKNSEKSA